MLRRPRQQTKRKRNGIRQQKVAAICKQKVKAISGLICRISYLITFVKNEAHKVADTRIYKISAAELVRFK